MKKVDGETRVIQRENISVTEIDQDKVMMDLVTGKYYILNTIGSRIWGCLLEDKTIDSVVCELTKSYEIDRETCEKEVFNFIEQLIQEKLVCVMN